MQYQCYKKPGCRIAHTLVQGDVQLGSFKLLASIEGSPVAVNPNYVGYLVISDLRMIVSQGERRDIR
jgi:hypothetical protein